MLNIRCVNEVLPIVDSELHNGYQVTITPVYEAFWKEKVDHYQIDFTKLKKITNY